MRTTPRRSRLPAVAILTLALAAFPLGTLAIHDFADVPNTNPFHNDISALAAAGVTFGCGGGNYCPSAFVTREQMAAFLNRLGALAPGKVPVVNADRVDGLDSTEFLTSSAIIVHEITPWESSSGLLISHNLTNEQLLRTSAGFGSAQFGLTAPTLLGGRAYGLLEVELCFVASASAVIDSWGVQEVSPLAVSIPVLFDADGFTPTLAGCHTLSLGAPDPVGNVYLVFVNQTTSAGASGLKVTRVTSTWSPI
jgi:hypothetical protein